ncbi:MAG: DNA polymerase III subunit gamma/tau [bacterium]
MSYQALARKWRPRSFDQVIGQEHVVSALTNALDSQRVHHAYLFTGTRGVGKTTLARIFARALNCESGISSDPCGQCSACRGVDEGNYIDLIEVDAASRTRVDDTRELLDNVQYSPTQGRFKIYLIDEVHMLSAHSFNALLKTLEEPPAHVKFLLATTDPQKLPATILSRCIQFNLKAIDMEKLNHQLQKILEAEGLEHESEALMVLSRSADGSVRDALSLLDQAIAFGDGVVKADQVRSMLGMIDDQFTHELLEQVCAKDGAALLQTVSRMSERSLDYKSALDDILSALHNAALYQVDPQAVEWKGVDSEAVASLARLADAELLQLLFQIALMGKRDLGLAPDPRTGFEMVLLRMNSFQPAHNGQTPAEAGSRISRETRVPPAKKEEASKSVTGALGRVDAEKTANYVDKAKEIDTPATKVNGAYTLEKLVSQSGWSEFVEDSGLSGISKELVMNMVPQTLEGDQLHLLLDQSSRHLYNESRLVKIQKHCVDVLGQDIRLSIVVDQVDTEETETPSQQKQRHAKERQISAEQAFKEDQNVQTLVDLFDAEVVTDSIRPPVE